jgi:hypothetical protein
MGVEYIQLISFTADRADDHAALTARNRILLSVYAGTKEFLSSRNSLYFVNLRRASPAIPAKPVPSSSMLVGSGTALPVTMPCKLVTPVPAPPVPPHVGQTIRNEGSIV